MRIFTYVKKAELKRTRKLLGKRIRELREKQGITQAQLAYECGLSREQIYRTELGYKNISIDGLHAIASSLDISLKDLFDFK